MIFPLAAAIGFAVYLALRWVIRVDDRARERVRLLAAFEMAEHHGRTLLHFDRIERGEEHLLPKARHGLES